MRVHSLLLVLTLAATAVCGWPTFSQYCTTFGKSYNTTEAIFREKVYNQTVTKLQNDATSGPTQFSDWTDQEISNFLSVRPNPNEKPDKLPQRSSLSVSAGSSLDWRNSGKVSDIKNQGTCGACWSFSTAALVESYFLLKGKKYDLSEQYLLECTPNSTCAGGYVDEAINKFISTGMPQESTYPYLGSNFGIVGVPTTPGGICNSTSNIKGSATLKLNYYTNITDRNFKIQMADAPFVSLIYADTGFMNYKNGTYGCAPNTTMEELNHAVLVIGYNQNGDYLIKNSWGTGWGMSGFGIVNATNDCGMKIATYVMNWGFRAMSSVMALLVAMLVLFS